MSENELPILIVGAGPVGLVAALELTRLGKKVRIIEAKRTRSSYSKALAINARTLELMEPSGTTDILLKKGRKVPGMRATHNGRLLFCFEFQQIAHRYNFMVILPQSDSEAVFEAQLKKLGVMVEREFTLVDFTQDNVSVSAALDKKGKQIIVQASHIIGADGAHSVVRKTLNLNFPGEAMEGKWSLVDVELNNPLTGDWVSIDFRDDHVLGQIKIRDNLYRLFSNKPDALGNLPTGCRAGKVHWKTDFTISHRQVEKYQIGRAFLMGDAAHIHSPLGGRGMNLGIEDACDLAGRFAYGGLEDYSKVRHKVGKAVIKAVAGQTNMFISTNPVTKFMIRRIIPLFLRRKAIQKRMIRKMMGIGGP